MENLLGVVHAPENEQVPENEASNARQARLDRILNGTKRPVAEDQLGREKKSYAWGVKVPLVG